MVEVRILNDEVEDAAMYDTTTSDSDDECEEYENVDNNAGYDGSPADRQTKFKMVHKRWEDLYDFDGSKQLRDCMKRHLYREKFGNAAMSTSHMWMDSYNPLVL